MRVPDCPCSVLLFAVADAVELERVAVASAAAAAAVDADLVDGAGRRARRVGPAPLRPAVALEPVVVVLGEICSVLSLFSLKNSIEEASELSKYFLQLQRISEKFDLFNSMRSAMA